MSTWITRGEAARRLGISKSGLIKLECREIFPAVDVKGLRDKKHARYFNPDDVERLMRERGQFRRKNLSPGSIAARAFEMLEKGTTLREMVCKLEITPAEARALQREYETPLGEAAPEDPAVVRAREEREHARKLRELDKQIAALAHSKRRRTG